jgi:hypothetical protein
MLAAPVRSCQGTSARLPAPFHIDLGFVENPEQKQVYVSPIYLADLDALEKKMARELYEEDWRRVRDDKRAAKEERRARGEETQTQAAPSPSDQTTKVNKVKELPRSRVLSDMTLFRLLTIDFMKPSKQPRSWGEIVTKTGSVMKLIPTAVREAMFRAQHYDLNKRIVDIATGAATDDGSNPKLHEKYIKQLQWQEDVHERVARIMRKRILVALRALAEQAEDDDRNAKEVKVLALPTDTNTATRAECPSGSILLHIGPGDTASLVSSSIFASTDNTTPGSPGLDGDGSSPSPPLPSNPLLPPMVAFDSGTHRNRIPVFPLSRMLSRAPNDADTDADTVSPELSALTDLMAKHNTVLTNNNKSNSQTDHLLLVRPGVGPPKAVVEEVWQLWRYLGGSSMRLVDDPETEGNLLPETEKYWEDPPSETTYFFKQFDIETQTGRPNAR